MLIVIKSMIVVRDQNNLCSIGGIQDFKYARYIQKHIKLSFKLNSLYQRACTSLTRKFDIKSHYFFPPAQAFDFDLD